MKVKHGIYPNIAVIIRKNRNILPIFADRPVCRGHPPVHVPQHLTLAALTGCGFFQVVGFCLKNALFK